MGLVLRYRKSSAQPEFSGAPIISGLPESLSLLTVTATLTGQAASRIRYFWYRHTASDGSDPIGELVGTESAYVPLQEDVGAYLRCGVEATNNAGIVTAYSNYTDAISSATPPAPPSIVSAASITGSAIAGQTVGVDYQFSGASAVVFQWYSYSSIERANPVPMGTASTQLLSESSGPYIGVEVFGQNTAGEVMTRAVIPMVGVDPWEPVPAASYVPPEYDLTGMTPVYCNAGDNLQTKINALVPGEYLVLEAGATWTGNFYFPDTKTSDSDWIYVISSEVASLPTEGTRVTSANATNMPKIMAGSVSSRAMHIWRGVKKVRFVGIEFGTTYSLQNYIQYTILPVGYSSPYPEDPVTGTGNADNIVFDRCYIHGTTTGNNRDGFVLYQVTNWAITDCAIQDFHGVGVEAHGIHVYVTQGPGLIRNNLIEAAGINLFFGDSYLYNFIGPKDVTVIGNHINKPLSWYSADPSYAGHRWLVKNILEVKGGERLRFEANIFDRSFVQGELGGGCTFLCMGASIADVVFKNNIIRDVPGRSMMFAPTGEPSFASATLRRVRIENNLIYGSGNGGSGSPSGIGFTATTTKWNRYMRILHNSFAHNAVTKSGASWMQVIGFPTSAEDIDIRDNLYTAGSANIVTSGSSPVGYDATGLGYRLAGTWYFRHNCAIEAVYPYIWFNTPTANVYGHINVWSRTSAKVANISLSAPEHFVLDPTSPAAGAATDDTDIGCNISTLLVALAEHNDTTP